MIEIEGRVLGGLDEFMLRAGHLLTVCRIGYERGASLLHLHRETAARLASSVLVSESQNAAVANYLEEKALCRSIDSPTDRHPEEFGYPELETYRGSDGAIKVRTRRSEPLMISWQDRNFADPAIPSRVGAITATGRGGSKTGLSHILDWAQLLELIDSGGHVTPIGRLLVTLPTSARTSFEAWNPYVLGHEKIIIAFQYFSRDLDLLARLGRGLAREAHRLTKATCRNLFVEAMKTCVTDIDSSTATPRSRAELFRQLRDLERAGRKARATVETTSTAWHRTASRVETLTDLGLLRKGEKDDDEKYKYVYHPTTRLTLANETMAASATAQEWLEDHLVHVLLGVTSSVRGSEVELAEIVSLANVEKVVSAVKLPTTQFPIDCLTLGLAYVAAEANHFVSLGAIRRAVERLPLQHPDIARLARGHTGQRAEYISLNPQKLTAAAVP